MEITQMALQIIQMINERFNNDQSMDIIQLKNICSLYKSTTVQSSIHLNDLVFSSPQFDCSVITNNQIDTLKSPEFVKKYTFFIKTIYALLKMEIELFDTKKGIIVVHNNYQLTKSLETTKKQTITDHILFLKKWLKNEWVNTHHYHLYVTEFVTKIKILEKIACGIQKLVKLNIIQQNDNLLSLILPYFYVYDQYIEIYN